MASLTSLNFTGRDIFFEPILHHYSEIRPLGSLASLSLVDVVRQGNATGPYIWSTSALSTLTALHLCKVGKRMSPSMDELVTMLANTQALHTLRLEFTEFTTGPDRNYPEVSLLHLRRLHLNTLDDDTLAIIASVLTPGPQELDVQLWLGGLASSKSHAAVLSFLKRTTITCLSLRCGPPDGIVQLAEQLSCVPGLRMLELERHSSYDSQWTNLSALILPNTRDEFSARCPNLRLLWMNGGYVDSGTFTRLKQTVACHSLGIIVFRGKHVGCLIEDEELVVGWLRQRVENVLLDPNRSFWPFIGRDWDI
ncbi:hypothetical protein FRC12_005127 [Ceratobasidium sp. 428]|nr:hypothetical protein FRC12_005127 [Ceratobasidium sp. 428]